MGIEELKFAVEDRKRQLRERMRIAERLERYAAEARVDVEIANDALNKALVALFEATDQEVEKILKHS